jgi:hypothetical protein
MMKMLPAGIAVAVVLLSPLETAAKSRGAGLTAGAYYAYRGTAAFSKRYGVYRGYPLFGGFAPSTPYYPPYIERTSLAVSVPPPEPPYALTCQHSVQTITVPSEEGGTREIRITRC